MTHATLSPSGAHRWLECPGSVLLERGLPDQSSAFAEEGTRAHELAAEVMAHTGQWPRAHDLTADIEMAGHVQRYVELVGSLASGPTVGELLVEQSLDISEITGEPGAKGTADAVILHTHELIVVDLKYGRGVRVDAEENDQLRIYALAALNAFDLLGDFESVRLVIHQPRLGHVSEWALPVSELRAWGDTVKARAGHCLDILSTEIVGSEDFAPGDKPCRFCKAKASCQALAAKVQEAVGFDFESLTGWRGNAEQDAMTRKAVVDPLTKRSDAELAQAMGSVDLIEGWCKAVRAETESKLLAGVPIEGWKLVQGRRGARAWADAAEAETALKAMRLKADEMYEAKLISPTTAEKLHEAGTIGPRQWPKVLALIKQSEGKPSVAPASDKRPALAVQALVEDFDDESAGLT